MSELPLVHLLVDDPRRAAALEKPLLSAGFSVVTHRDATEARRAVAQRSPTERGVLVVTARLPGGDGAAIVADFRRLAPLLPIIAIEGGGADASESLHVSHLKAGADVYLTSPHSDEVIALQIRAMLAFGDRLRMLAPSKRSLTEPPQFTAFSGSADLESELDSLRSQKAMSPSIAGRFNDDFEEAAISEAPPTREFDGPIPSAAIATPVAPPVDLETMRRASFPSIPAPAGLPKLAEEPASEESFEVDLSEFDGGVASEVLSSSDLEEIPLVGPNSIRVSQASMIPEGEAPSAGRKESIPPDPKKLDEGW